MKSHEALLMRSVRDTRPSRLAAQNAAEGPFSSAFGIALRAWWSGLNGLNGRKHRPFFTRRRAVRPVSEGPQMPSRQAVKTNGMCGRNRFLRVRWEGFLWWVGRLVFSW